MVGGKVRFARDGRLLVSHGSDSTVRVWDVKTDTSRVLIGHDGAVTRLAFAPDGKSLASGGADGSVRVWGLTGEEPRIVERATAPIAELAWGRGGLAYASGDLVVRLGDERREQRLGGAVTAFTFSPDGGRLATGARDGSVHVVEVDTGDERVLSGHRAGDVTLAFSADGRTLASKGAEGTICLWEDARPPCRELVQSCRSALPPALSPDGRRLMTACRIERLEAWDARTGASQGGLMPDDYQGFKELVLSPDGRWAAALVPLAMSIVLVDPRVPGPPRRLTGLREEFEHAVFSPDGRVLAAACFDDSLEIWDVASGEGRVLDGHRGRVLDLAFSPDGALVASASADGTIRLWPDDLPRGEAGLRAWLAAATPERVAP